VAKKESRFSIRINERRFTRLAPDFCDMDGYEIYFLPVHNFSEHEVKHEGADKCVNLAKIYGELDVYR